MLLNLAYKRLVRFSDGPSNTYGTLFSLSVVKWPRHTHLLKVRRSLHAAKPWLSISHRLFNTGSRRAHTLNMATPTSVDSSKHPSLVGTTPIANVQASYTSVNPVEVYRQHIGQLLAPIVGINAEEIVPRLQWTLTQDKGDLMLAAPSLRIKGKKPNEQAAEWGEKVCSLKGRVTRVLLSVCMSSFQNPTWWRSP